MYPMLLASCTATGERTKACFSVASGKEENEIFLLSGRDSSENTIKNGDFKGLGINEAISRVMPGDNEPYSFPIFIRLVNTDSRLPVTVYPGKEYATAHGKGEGKSSLIYIADCANGAEMVYGLSRNVSPEELRRRVENGSLSAVCNFVNVQKGDVFFIPEGIVFAIGGGICAVEISVNSDDEYLISDYGRLGDDGRPRPLQVNRALEVMKRKKIDVPYGNTGDMTLYPFGTVRELAEYESFSVKEINLDGNAGFYDEEKMISLVLISGEIDLSYSLGTMRLKSADSVLVPKGVKVRLSGRAKIIYTEF